jgi:5'-nucleotidase
MKPEHALPPRPPAARDMFCNRTLNLRAIRAIGYDMDYTLVHYKIAEWERRAYEYLQQKLGEAGWPVAKLEFQPELTMRGLILDMELGNIVKADRFGYVKQAFHGTRRMAYDEARAAYSRTLVDLADSRWYFLNTFFSLSEACMYLQLVDLRDAGAFGGEVMGYRRLADMIRRSLDQTHAQGRLKAEIIEQPDRFVELDEDVPRTLLDQKEAGKRLLVITNSEWLYTQAMMSYCFDPFLPGSMTWRDLFELVICAARKPAFFSERGPLYEVVSDDGLLQQVVGAPNVGGVYVGGNVTLIEEYLGLSGSEILYVGDHLYADVRLTKDILRWRTALMVRELERELEAIHGFREQQDVLNALMAKKEELEYRYSQLRLMHLRADGDPRRRQEVEAAMLELRSGLERLDTDIAPLAHQSNRLFNEDWGLLMRAGRDKSHMARQIERYADVYTSRVSNFLFQTPFVYLRSPRGSMPHDPTVGPGWAAPDQ